MDEPKGIDYTPLYAIPEGYKIVPIEITPKQIQKAAQDYVTYYKGEKGLLGQTIIQIVHKAMIEATPEPK